MARTRLRFAFTIAEGPNAGLTNGGWRLWINGDTTYLTTKPLEGSWKVSLHGDKAWRVAMTKEHLLTEQPVWSPDQDRAPWKFDPPPFVGGRRMAFAIAVTRGCLRPELLDDSELHIAVQERWDVVTVAYVWQAEPGLAVEPSARPVGEVLTMKNGRQVWMTADTEDVGPHEPEPIPVSSMVEPQSPAEHGVRAPGLLIRGVHLG